MFWFMFDLACVIVAWCLCVYCFGFIVAFAVACSFCLLGVCFRLLFLGGCYIYLFRVFVLLV